MITDCLLQSRMKKEELKHLKAVTELWIKRSNNFEKVNKKLLELRDELQRELCAATSDKSADCGERQTNVKLETKLAEQKTIAFCRKTTFAERQQEKQKPIACNKRKCIHNPDARCASRNNRTTTKARHLYAFSTSHFGRFPCQAHNATSSKTIFGFRHSNCWAKRRYNHRHCQSG